MELLVDSEWTVWSSTHMGIEGLRVVDVESIVACVSMQPHIHHVEPNDVRYFVWEQSGMEIGILGGYKETDEGDEDGGGGDE